MCVGGEMRRHVYNFLSVFFSCLAIVSMLALADNTSVIIIMATQAAGVFLILGRIDKE